MRPVFGSSPTDSKDTLTQTDSEYLFRLEAPPARVHAALRGAAEAWGAGWEGAIDGGSLALPVVSGLRRGVLGGRVSLRSAGQGCQVRFEVEESHFRVNRPAAFILVMGALGGLCIVFWPFFPVLLGIAPVAVVLAFAAWLLVASRLRHSGPEDFFELVRRLVEDHAGP